MVHDYQKCNWTLLGHSWTTAEYKVWAMAHEGGLDWIKVVHSRHTVDNLWTNECRTEKSLCVKDFELSSCVLLFREQARFVDDVLQMQAAADIARVRGGAAGDHGGEVVQ